MQKILQIGLENVAKVAANSFFTQLFPAICTTYLCSDFRKPVLRLDLWDNILRREIYIFVEKQILSLIFLTAMSEKRI